MMDASLIQSPFAIVTFIVAPAMLTNASSVLAMSTINRMLRTRDRMHEIFNEARKTGIYPTDSAHGLAQITRVERQALLLLQALGAIYVALGAFAGGTFMTLIGGSLSTLLDVFMQRLLVLIGIGLVFIGVAGLIFGSVRLFQATQLSILNLRAEADLLRQKKLPL